MNFLVRAVHRLSLCNSLLQRHAVEIAGGEESAGLAVIYKGSGYYSGDRTFRCVGSLGAAEVCPAPAGICKADDDIAALEL